MRGDQMKRVKMIPAWEPPADNKAPAAPEPTKPPEPIESSEPASPPDQEADPHHPKTN
jgi:hypothetical protein